MTRMMRMARWKRLLFPNSVQVSMANNVKIGKLRIRIDQLDDEILRLVNQRIDCAKEVGVIKSETGDKVVYRPERESQILNRLTEINSGPLRPAELQTIFRDIISIARAAESLPRIAVLGRTFR